MEERMVMVYGVNELSERALEKAYSTWSYDGPDYGWHSENEATLDAFEDIFPVDVSNWEYDQWRGFVRFAFTEDDEIEALTGHRLATYIHNNYYDQITKGKYYSLWSKKDQNPHFREGGHAPMGKLKSRYSKVITHTRSACPFTGYYMDDVILEPIWDFLEKPTNNMDFRDLMHECFKAWAKACSEDYRGCTSLEYFQEQANENDYRFYEDGTRFHH